MKQLFLFTDNKKGLKEGFTKLKTLAGQHGFSYNTLVYQFTRKQRTHYSDDNGRTVELLPLNTD